MQLFHRKNFSENFNENFNYVFSKFQFLSNRPTGNDYSDDCYSR